MRRRDSPHDRPPKAAATWPGSRRPKESLTQSVQIVVAHARAIILDPTHGSMVSPGRHSASGCATGRTRAWTARRPRQRGVQFATRAPAQRPARGVALSGGRGTAAPEPLRRAPSSYRSTGLIRNRPPLCQGPLLGPVRRRVRSGSATQYRCDEYVAGHRSHP